MVTSCEPLLVNHDTDAALVQEIHNANGPVKVEGVFIGRICATNSKRRMTLKPSSCILSASLAHFPGPYFGIPTSAAIFFSGQTFQSPLCQFLSRFFRASALASGVIASVFCAPVAFATASRGKGLTARLCYKCEFLQSVASGLSQFRMDAGYCPGIDAGVHPVRNGMVLGAKVSVILLA